MCYIYIRGYIHQKFAMEYMIKHTIPILCMVPPIIHINFKSASNDKLKLLCIKVLQQANRHHLYNSMTCS